MVVNPLVVGAPRSGFSLLISVISQIQNLINYDAYRDNKTRIIRCLVEIATYYTTKKYQQTFEKFGIVEDLIYNGEFHLLVGGPKWLSKENNNLACFRKYFGVKGKGDFLLITSHPKEVFEYYPVLHSHTAPKLWLEQPYYDQFKKFTSVRNPLGIINSSCFSLNAMASEYIQKFVDNEDEEIIRQRLGLYKITDMDFFMGIVKFLIGYLDEFLLVKDRYYTMKWEDLITSPVKTIKAIANALEVEITDDGALNIWEPLDHRNLLLHHKHNYRRGKGIVGDWKNSLVNEHMELFRELGLNDYMAALDYDPIPELDSRDYSPYQKLAARYIQRNEIYRNTGDPDLFGFAFNKSNIDASKFNFKSFPKKQWTHVERSTLSDDDIVESVSAVAEAACDRVNNILLEAINAEIKSKGDIHKLIVSLEQRCLELVQEFGEVQSEHFCKSKFQLLNSHLN
jgi:hypothetical protein